MKACTRCGIVKPLTEFSKDKRLKSGLQSSCKSCEAERRKQHYQANKETIKEKSRQYHHANKEAINERSRQYYQKPEVKEAISEKSRQYHQANKEARNEYARQYRQANKEAIVEQKRQDYQDNKEARKESARQYQQANKEARRQYRQDRDAAQPACVYEILNAVNNRAYIGQTTRGELRWVAHKGCLKRNRHDNRNLQADFNKYGLEAFEWRVLQEFETKDEKVLLREEAKTIQQYVREGRKLYNLTLTIEQLEMLEQ